MCTPVSARVIYWTDAASNIIQSRSMDKDGSDVISIYDREIDGFDQLYFHSIASDSSHLYISDRQNR